MIKHCAIPTCGKPFEASGVRIYCSPECSKQGKKLKNRESYDRCRVPNEVYCTRCNAFLGDVKADTRYCDGCRLEVQRENGRKSKANSYVPVGPKVLFCGDCGVRIYSELNKRKYCPECLEARLKQSKAESQDRRRDKGLGFVDACRWRGVPFAYAVPDYWHLRIIEEQGGVCAKPGCDVAHGGKGERLHADHKISVDNLKKMGIYETRINMLQFLCGSHNSEKNNNDANYHPKRLQDKLNYLDACFEQMELCA